eukprot:TRINITY_DN232_c0_g1_i3.p1 TRINITY_DN232_c0_g1~~TRINITY_DN232_c0_g1_i3.p1  ORF type:complete len:835 (-),score=292.02 TRINITY_DN232_c0_g1_i3:119-2623(-)
MAGVTTHGDLESARVAACDLGTAAFVLASAPRCGGAVTFRRGAGAGQSLTTVGSVPIPAGVSCTSMAFRYSDPPMLAAGLSNATVLIALVDLGPNGTGVRLLATLGTGADVAVDGGVTCVAWGGAGAARRAVNADGSGTPPSTLQYFLCGTLSGHICMFHCPPQSAVDASPFLAGTAGPVSLVPPSWRAHRSQGPITALACAGDPAVRALFAVGMTTGVVEVHDARSATPGEPVINYAHGPELAVMALDWGDRVHMGVVERLIKDQAKEADSSSTPKKADKEAKVPTTPGIHVPEPPLGTSASLTIGLSDGTARCVDFASTADPPATARLIAVSHATDVSSIHAASWVSLPTSNLEAPFVVTTGSDGIVKAMSLRPPRRGTTAAVPVIFAKFRSCMTQSELAQLHELHEAQQREAQALAAQGAAPRAVPPLQGVFGRVEVALGTAAFPEVPAGVSVAPILSSVSSLAPLLGGSLIAVATGSGHVTIADAGAAARSAFEALPRKRRGRPALPESERKRYVPKQRTPREPREPRQKKRRRTASDGESEYSSASFDKVASDEPKIVRFGGGKDDDREYFDGPAAARKKARRALKKAAKRSGRAANANASADANADGDADAGAPRRQSSGRQRKPPKYLADIYDDPDVIHTSDEERVGSSSYGSDEDTGAGDGAEGQQPEQQQQQPEQQHQQQPEQHQQQQQQQQQPEGQTEGQANGQAAEQPVVAQQQAEGQASAVAQAASVDAQPEAPQTEAPTAQAPQSEAPETEAPETEAPETEAPQSEAPETEASQAQSEAPQAAPIAAEPAATAPVAMESAEANAATTTTATANVDGFPAGN